MSNELQVRDEFEKGLHDLLRIQDVTRKLMETSHYKKMGADGIFAIVSYAKILGMNPLEALNGALYYVNGKVGMSAERMCLLIRQAGHSLVKSPKSTDTNVILIGKRKDTGNEWTTSFSIEEAKKAGLVRSGNSWEKYPSDMCYNRAVTRMFRQMTPELAKGAGYDKEELESIKHENELIEEPADIILNKINEQQLQNITSILNECSPDYVSVIARRLEKLDIKHYKDMTVEVYEKLLPHAISSRDAHQKSLVEKEMMMTDEHAVVEGVSEVEE